MSNRVIKSKSRGSSVLLVDCLSSHLTLELLSPSPELYLISPWLSQVPLINNRFGQFRVLTSELNKSELHLADILTLLAEKGTHIYIMCRPNHPPTEAFLKPLLSNQRSIKCRQSENLHEKGLISHHFYLRGSMNFTYSGVNLNDESIEVDTEHAVVGRALVEARRTWEGMIE
jgi:hypothetical protein